MMTTRQVLLNHIRARFHENDFYGSELDPIRELFTELGEENSPAVIHINHFAQQLDADEFERRFINMGAQQFDLMNESARQRYVQILDDMFHDRTITWGRLVMVMIYTGKLACLAMRSGHPGHVQDLVEWCELYFQQNFLEAWVVANGGWSKLPQLSAADWQRRVIQKELRTVTAAAVAIGAIFLTAVFILKRNH